VQRYLAGVLLPRPNLGKQAKVGLQVYPSGSPAPWSSDTGGSLEKATV